MRLNIVLLRNLYSASSRQFTTSSCVYNKPSSSKFQTSSPDSSNNNESNKFVENEVQQRISKILADIPQGGRLIEEPQIINESKVKSEPTFSSTGNDADPIIDSTSTHSKKINKENSTASHEAQSNNKYTYSDIFNIKQIIDTVKESENVKQLQKELTIFYNTKKKEQQELKDSLSKRVGNNVVELKQSIRIASNVVNEITGYNKVMKLKDIIVENEQKLKDIKEAIHNAKVDHEKALELRSSSQKEVNELLERKNSWNPVDLDRFTRIYMTTHDLDKTVKDSTGNLKNLEELQETTHDALIRSIMNRYHEEQIWSDKIRQFSTWGTILIMCINMLLVLLVQFVFEPFKRWRLVSSFEGKVKDLFQNSEKLDSDIQDLKEQLERLNSASIQKFAATTATDASVTQNSESIENYAGQPAELEETTGPTVAELEEISTNTIYVLPPFRIINGRKLDTKTLSLYIKHYYKILNGWIKEFAGYMSPISYRSAKPLNTTVGEFQTFVGSSILLSTICGIIIGHIVL